MFSTEELRLATGALRRLSLAKKDVFVVIPQTVLALEGFLLVS